MGFVDKAKDVAVQAKDKATEVAGSLADKAGPLTEKAGPLAKKAGPLAEKREGCRWYRSRRRRPRVPREREPFYGVFAPYTRTVSVNDPDNIAGVSALLDTSLTEVAQIEVTEAKEKLSIARITSGKSTGVHKGMGVHTQ